MSSKRSKNIQMRTDQKRSSMFTFIGYWKGDPVCLKSLTTSRAKQESSKCTPMLTFIIFLCLLVRSVQSFSEQIKESHKNSSRKLRSIDSRIAHNENELHHLNSYGRGWQDFNSWSNNKPQVIKFGRVAYTVINGNRKHQHLLLSGGMKYYEFLYNDLTSRTWLYTLDTNSWQMVDSNELQQLSENLVMVQLCTKIIVFEALNINNFSNSCHVSIFDTISLKWKQTQLYGDFDNWTSLITDKKLSVKVTGLSVQHTQTNCQCKQSALIFSHFFYVSDMKQAKYKAGEIRCVHLKETEMYEWIEMNMNIPHTSYFQFNLASTYSSGLVLYVPYQEIFWKFENNVWTNLSKIPYHLQPFDRTLPIDTFGCLVAKNTSRYIVFNIRNKKVVNFDLKRNEFVIQNVVSYIPSSWYTQVVSTLFETENKFVVFLADFLRSSTKVWKFIYENKVWIWKEWPDPDLHPNYPAQATYALKDNYLTLSGKSRDNTLLVDTPQYGLFSGALWNLDLTTMQWWLKIKGNVSQFSNCEVSCWISNSCYVTLCKIERHTIDAWIYNTSDDNSWKLLISTSLTNDLSDMSFVAANKSTAIVFGGRSPTEHLAVSNTWILSLETKPIWKQVSDNRIHSVRPRARSKHAAVMMQSQMYVFGGMSDSGKCLNDLWVFDVNTERWAEVTAVNKRPDLSDIWPCVYTAASTPGQLMVTVTCDSNYRRRGLTTRLCNYLKYRMLKTWMFIVQSRTWHLIASSKINEKVFILRNRVVLKSVYWKGFLVMLDPRRVIIKYLAVRCPAGFTSLNISDRPCSFCEKGYYRETIFDDPDCVPCPNGLTTDTVGARHIRECTMCDVNLCKYGKCVPDYSNESLQPTCRCYVGFTGSTCQYPTYYLICAGLILFVAVTSAGVTAYLLVLKSKKVSDRAWRRQVDVLIDVWQIDENEVDLQEMIESGAFGTVYKAYYRNIVVAVKKMIAEGLSNSTEDFETEIMFMRTVRHKNIVLFIGAGKSQPEDVPFLVMEYMERGSLKKVLYDSSIDLDYDRKLSFAMDSARGMHFLHTLEPPRIHRDLKSDNLLVSRDWIVKVADFGLGRSIKYDIRRNDRLLPKRRNRLDPHHIPLLPQRQDLTYAGVGTARWRAPELSLGEPYDTAVDVYSFGIVLWEIWTRQLPFDQYRFDYQLTDAVIANERPVIPQHCPQSLATIIRNCWSPRPSDRLTFAQVISSLQSLENS